MHNNDDLTFFQGEPLIEVDNTLKGLAPDGVTGRSLYFGTGLTTAKVMSVGIPFDVLKMFLLAEKLRRHFGLKKSIQLVADTHALSNSFVDANRVVELTGMFDTTMTAAAKACGWPDRFQLIRSSDLAQEADYSRLFRSIQTDDHEYVRREWTDILYLQEREGLALKLSWIVDPKAKAVGFDERLYDLRFNEVTGKHVSFVYTGPGRTFDAHRPKASPYIAIPDETRLMLSPDEDIISKLEVAQKEADEGRLPQKLFDRATEHLGHIVRLYAELTGYQADNTAPLGQQLTAIQQRIFAA